MKKTVFLSAFIAFVLCCRVIPVQAQIFNKLFGTSQKEPARKETPAPAIQSKPKPVPTLQVTKPENVLDLKPTVFKVRYRVDVLAAVYLNELVVNDKSVYKSHLPAKVLPGIGFYQGIKLAADTLNRLGYKLDVYFHDIGDPANNPDDLIKNGRLDSSDLIIGAVAASQVVPLANFAKRHSINFISTMSPFDGNIKKNPYFSLLQPTLKQHCKAISEVLSSKSASDNILVYHRASSNLDDYCYKLITKDKAFRFAPVLMNTPMPEENLRNFLDSSLTNIIVMPIVNTGYATKLLEQLNTSFPKYRFEVYGMPSWKGLPELTTEGAWANLGITIGEPFFFDATISAGQSLSGRFTEMFGGKPSEMAFRGYELMYWYAYLLKKYGTIFNEHYTDNGVTPFTRYQFVLDKDENQTPLYFVNKHLYLFRYQAGSFSILWQTPEK